MSAIALFALLQAAAYGPPAPSPATDRPQRSAASSCPDTGGTEIVVCAKRDPGRPQELGELTPPERGDLDQDNRGLFGLKLGDKAKLKGGGPKTSAGVGLRLGF